MTIPIAHPEARLDTSRPFHPLRIAVMTISDTRDETTDTSGALLASRIVDRGHTLAARAYVPDDVAAIQSRARGFIADAQVDVVISTGGTGLTARDVTPEALRPLFDKELEGFTVVWHLVSYHTVGLSTLQSRALAGLAQGTLLFAFPGSTSACRDGWDHILQWLLDSRHRPCNLVDLIPRFARG